MCFPDTGVLTTGTLGAFWRLRRDVRRQLRRGHRVELAEGADALLAGLGKNTSRLPRQIVFLVDAQREDKSLFFGIMRRVDRDLVFAAGIAAYGEHLAALGVAVFDDPSER